MVEQIEFASKIEKNSTIENVHPSYRKRTLNVNKCFTKSILSCGVLGESHVGPKFILPPIRQMASVMSKYGFSKFDYTI